MKTATFPRRQIAAVSRGPYYHPAPRAVPRGAYGVPDRQLGRSPAPTLSDRATQNFFAEGNRQEEKGVFHETSHVHIRSLDRVPRTWWPTLLALCVLVAAAAVGSWWLGFRPPEDWQRSEIWQQLHLPQMPPAS